MSDPADRTQAFQQPRTIRPDILDMSQDARCPDCHAPLVWKHDVYCPGPAQRVWWSEPAVSECDCPAGAWHLPDCELVA